ncbi:uncharacterized protein LOC125044495 [Penaeus chinensis]|uniref:uncharacterized protein LOC125044495 n=1 Tax=Penaeus chinensis TaxID=139456 RepID=UPI001FB686E9|nr:uncharacterized protein LOC125044495 [Penaeus chinensis]
MCTSPFSPSLPPSRPTTKNVHNTRTRARVCVSLKEVTGIGNEARGRTPPPLLARKDLRHTDPRKTAVRAQPQVFRGHLLQTDVCQWGGSLASHPHSLVATPTSTLSQEEDVTAKKTVGCCAIEYFIRFVCLSICQNAYFR